MASAMNKVVHVLSQFPNLTESIKQVLPDVQVKNVQIRAYQGKFIWEMPIGQEEIDDLSDAEILVADNNLIPKVLFKMPNIKWIQSSWAGIELILKEVKSHGSPPSFPVTRFSGQAFGQIMGEYVLAQIINRERDFYQTFVNTKINKKWIKDVSWDYRSTNEITVAILGGTGAIGSYIANLFHRIGINVIGFGKEPKSHDLIKSIPLQKYSTELHDILPNCDYLLSVLPSTTNTIGLLNGEKLKLCAIKKPVFINIGRGSVIDDSELIKALDNQWISGAILDVFNEEPLPPSSPLWHHEKVLITPHIAAKSRPSDLVQLFAENYNNFISGKPLKYVIKWDEGY